MWSVRVEEPEQTVQCVTRLVSGLLPSVFGYDPLNDIQIICPGHQNVAGTVNLNRALQNALNPLCLDDPYINVPGGQFRIGDRVLQTTNDKTRDLSNGDIGRIVEISRDRANGTAKAIVSVDFRGRVVSYMPADLGQLSLAYAISCHKSQGSEFPVVLAVMTYQHRIMLTRSLIYTAVTRAREICCVIGQRQAIRTAILDPGELRITALARRIVDRAIAKGYGVDAPRSRENGPPDTVTGHGVFRKGAAASTGIDRLPLFAG
jgi:exodeoxyribonuclease V alpha subunit